MRPVKTLPLPNLSGNAAPQLSMPVPVPQVTPLHVPPPTPVVSMPLVTIPERVPNSLQDAFVRERKRVLGTNMREDLYSWIQEYPGGVSAFFEHAIKTFDGSLEELISAGARFEDTRRAGNGPAGPVNARVAPNLHQKTLEMLEAARRAKVKRASHSKIVAGYLQLALEKLQGSTQNEGAVEE